MADNLNIALIQSKLVWENPRKNRIDFENKINALDDVVDLVILPEMFTSGFTMNPSHVAETMEGETISWLKTLAIKNQIALTGSLVIKENGNFYNRLIFVHPDGSIEHYDKRHTFTLAGEDKVYTAGTIKLIVDYKGWKICPLICYDLRFPVWSRNIENYDLLIYVANWPASRITAWDTLLKARAIENMSYCVGVNRVGTDNNNHDYTGHSAAYDVLGNRLDTIPFDNEAIEIVRLKKKDIKMYRNKLSFLSDRDQFSIG
ncbi:putative amidohydrolase [Gelidibacter sediminis]|uniref:Omega-amidase YafV n=1 Tax=Gelidibacter sediminis TaxID=1608710 RepID=A0A4R7Q863_9FLAO|nr:amidohydrolase [Gelidibacter sediminis]TDU43182.1 putative amidohydrolase [Gelidibacter sediminis]